MIQRARLKTPDHNLPECGLLNMSYPLRGDFIKDPATGQVRYQLRGCRLRRLEPQDALACLGGKHVVFVGDSLTRFQYISLAHFLIHGRFQRPYDINPAPGLSLVPPYVASSLGDGASELGTVHAARQAACDAPGGCGGSAARRARDDRSPSPLQRQRHSVPSVLPPSTRPGPVDRADARAAGSDTTRGGGGGGQDAAQGESARGGGSDAWAAFYHSTMQHLTVPGCVNATCSFYRNPTDHAPGEDPRSRAREYWRVRMELEDRSTTQLSMGLVYGFPDFATAGINGLRWAFGAARKPPDMVVFNLGLWWGHLYGYSPGDSSISRVVAAFEEVFHWGQRHVQKQGLRTRLVYRTTTPVADAHDNFWWKVWPTRVEPVLIHVARTYGWEVSDAREVVTAAYKQSLVAAWDAVHLTPFLYEQLNDLLLNSMCSPGTHGWAGGSSRA